MAKLDEPLHVPCAAPPKQTPFAAGPSAFSSTAARRRSLLAAQPSFGHGGAAAMHPAPPAGTPPATARVTRTGSLAVPVGHLGPPPVMSSAMARTSSTGMQGALAPGTPGAALYSMHAQHVSVRQSLDLPARCTAAPRQSLGASMLGRYGSTSHSQLQLLDDPPSSQQLHPQSSSGSWSQQVPQGSPLAAARTLSRMGSVASSGLNSPGSPASPNSSLSCGAASSATGLPTISSKAQGQPKKGLLARLGIFK